MRQSQSLLDPESWNIVVAPCIDRRSCLFKKQNDNYICINVIDEKPYRKSDIKL